MFMMQPTEMTIGYGIPDAATYAAKSIMHLDLCCDLMISSLKCVEVFNEILLPIFKVPYLEGLWNRLHDIHIGWPALGASLITIWTAWHFRPIKVSEFDDISIMNKLWTSNRMFVQVRDVSLTIEEALRYKVGIRGDYIEVRCRTLRFMNAAASENRLALLLDVAWSV